jgi:hypothetical protein
MCSHKIIVAVLIVFFALVSGAAAAFAGAVPKVADPEVAFGVEVLSLRPTAHGQMLDLRFRVTDPDKARSILDKRQRAYLLDARTGKSLPVPVTKSGSLRQTTPRPEAGRVYFMLFSNTGRIVREGDRVDLVVGAFKREGLIVGSAGKMSTAQPPAVKHSDAESGQNS